MKRDTFFLLIKDKDFTIYWSKPMMFFDKKWLKQHGMFLFPVTQETKTSKIRLFMHKVQNSESYQNKYRSPKIRQKLEKSA